VTPSKRIGGARSSLRFLRPVEYIIDVIKKATEGKKKLSTVKGDNNTHKGEITVSGDKTWRKRRFSLYGLVMLIG